MAARSSQDFALLLRALKVGFRFVVSGPGEIEGDFSDDAIDLGFAPPLFSCFHGGHRFGRAC